MSVPYVVIFSLGFPFQSLPLRVTHNSSFNLDISEYHNSYRIIGHLSLFLEILISFELSLSQTVFVQRINRTC